MSRSIDLDLGRFERHRRYPFPSEEGDVIIGLIVHDHSRYFCPQISTAQPQAREEGRCSISSRFGRV